jgi:hypothetical protein
MFALNGFQALEVLNRLFLTFLAKGGGSSRLGKAAAAFTSASLPTWV